MDNTNRFSLMIDALTELAEEEQAHRVRARAWSTYIDICYH